MDIFIILFIFEIVVLLGLEVMKCGVVFVVVYVGGNIEYCWYEDICLLFYCYENCLVLDILCLIED